MNGVQCDQCRAFTPGYLPAGWLTLFGQELPQGSAVEALEAMFGTAPEAAPRLRGTFCGARCLTEYAYVRLALEGQATAAEPRPRAGLGWPG